MVQYRPVSLCAPTMMDVAFDEATTFSGGHEWLARHGVTVTVLDDPRCAALMSAFIAAQPDLWHEDIGQAP